MKKRRLCWITSDEYIDVDLPILPPLARAYDIDWHIVIHKDAAIDHAGIIGRSMKGTTIHCSFHYLTSRRRSLAIIGQYWALLKQIRLEPYDVFYFDIEGLPYFFPLVAMTIGRNKVICAAHHVTIPVGAVNYHSARLYTAFVLAYFKYFHVFSRNQYAILQKRHPNKIAFYAPLALINFGNSDSSAPRDETVFLFFGFIRDYKRVDILIRAADMVFETTRERIKVKICGYCSNWDKYQKLIRHPEIYDLRIKTIPNDDIPRLFREAHYFVMPYQDVAQSATLTVAFNYRLPVIASDIEPLKEFIVDGTTGFLFQQGSAESLAGVMRKLLDRDDESYRTLKENISKEVQANYSPESIANTYAQFIDSIAGPPAQVRG